jgi:methyl-accepting chemotaxis protein
VVDIALAINEQGEASNNIAVQIERIAQMAEEASAAASQTAGAADKLKHSAEQQRDVLAEYKGLQ